MDRREFIKFSSLGLASCAFASSFDADKMLGKLGSQKQQIQAQQEDAIVEDLNIKKLLLLRRGSEKFEYIYYADGKYNFEAFKQFCLLTRDIHDGNTAVKMDFRLMDLLYQIQNMIASHGWREPISINSGYRSPKTNAATEGAAKNSYHTKGKAVDITIPADSNFIGIVGSEISKKGGVGFYPNKNFTHLDTGDIRTWQNGNDSSLKGII